jgi:hypothetical protein
MAGSNGPKSCIALVQLDFLYVKKPKLYNNYLTQTWWLFACVVVTKDQGKNDGLDNVSYLLS